MVILCGCGKQDLKEISIIPEPNSIIMGADSYRLDNTVKISVSSESMMNEAEYLGGFLSHRYGLNTEILAGDVAAGDIKLLIDPDIPNPEGYNLKSGKSGVTIEGQSEAGVFYGIQTLLQLLPEEGKPVIPAVEISDEPRFAWRGMLLDVCRHFFEVGDVKKILDAMAMHKLNTLHLHLTDDQGWRIEVDQYPRLMEVSAWRDETLVGHYSDKPRRYDGQKYGGYYTGEQVRELVAYAKKLHITVVPEIEMPGHSEAAIAGYPELSCFNKTEGVARIWGVRENVYCAGKESTFTFLENVLDEVCELFPSEYIHIGGDECPKTHWKKCPDCQKRIKQEGLKDEHELQSYFIQRIERHLNSRGKKLIGWDEILEGGLAENAAVMSWRGEQGGIAAANSGHNVVMTPTGWCYFDYYQSESTGEPLAIGGHLTLEKVYSYDPMPEKINPDKQHYILGVQANLWTEYIPTLDYAEYMIFPRLCAMSEVQWTLPGRKDYNDFLTRMEPHYGRLHAAGINYRVPIPEIDTLNFAGPDETGIDIRNEHPGLKMIYTLDGSDPDENSLVYAGPVEFPSSGPLTLKIRTLMPDGRMSLVVEGRFIRQELNRVSRDLPVKTLRYKLFSADNPVSVEFTKQQDGRQIPKNIKDAGAVGLKFF